MATSEAETAWLAGLLEGEGSFGMVNSRVGGKVYRYPKVTVNMTDRDVIEHAALLPGGNKVYDLPPSRQGSSRLRAYRATVTGWKAIEIMQALYPWLGQRRRVRIDEILAEYEAQEPTQRRRRRSCSEAAARRPRRSDGTFEKAA